MFLPLHWNNVRYLGLVVGLVPFLVGTPLDAQTGAAKEPLVLRAGDVIRITVWRSPELSGEFAISRNGTIAHPLYRTVNVAGLNLDAAEDRIRQLLSGLESTPRFVIQPLLRVSVGGEVREPSLYTLPPETSIAEAVALAGGATERGRMDAVRLFRRGQESLIDLTDPQGGLAQTPIRSGDQIFVQRRISIFREYIVPAASVTAAVATLIRLAFPR